MSCKVFFVAVVLLGLQCLFATGANAQGANPCLAISTWWFPDPIPFGWYYFAPYPAPFVYLIASNNTSCAPPSEDHECKACAGSPILLADGDTFIEQTDLVLPGLGGGLTLRRRWNSVWPTKELSSSTGIFGAHWKSTYEERVFMGGDNWVKYARSDGSYTPFGFSTTGSFSSIFAGTGNVRMALMPNVTSLVLSLPNGETRKFDSSTGLLQSITDRNNNQTLVTWDSNGRLTTVTDPASRHLYFNYPTGSNLVSSVTTDFGVTVSYSYDSQNRLSQITRPDQTTINFSYDAQSNIISVTDQNGKVLESHTYDSNGRGLTSAQANGVNSLSVTYP